MAKADFKTEPSRNAYGTATTNAWGDETAADPLHCPRIDSEAFGG
jgi:hypothetical protein